MGEEGSVQALRHMLRDNTERGSLIRDEAMAAHDTIIHEAFDDGVRTNSLPPLLDLMPCLFVNLGCR